MKKIFLLPIAALAFTACGGGEAEVVADEPVLFDTDDKKISYMIGFQEVAILKQNGVDYIDQEAFYEGFKDAINGSDSMRVDEAEAMELFRMKAQKPYMARKEAGEQFLMNNASKEGVTTLNSGLQYEVLVAGNGPIPTIQNEIKAHYHGTLIDGTVFDSSVERGTPAEFPVGGVIPGWVEALQLMPVGSKWRLYIPQELAYGERGAGGVIGPFEALIFDVELLEIVK